MRVGRLTSLTWLISLALAGAIGAWAGAVALTPPATVGNDPQPVLYTVGTGTVSRIQSFTAEATWQGTPAGRNAAEGTVTSVDITPGQLVDAGDRLYSIDLQPVTAAKGDVPAFRRLSTGDRGADVAQIQRFLAGAGFYAGVISGRFSAATKSAVAAWQKATGRTADGSISQGDFVFLRSLPSRVRPTAALTVGAVIGPGEVAIDSLPSDPSFSITLSADQAGLVPLTAQVLVHHRGGSWDAEIASTTSTAQGDLTLILRGADGGSICGTECTDVPADGSALFRSDIVAVPATTGPVVPSAALQSRPDGSVFVRDMYGAEMNVTVIASANGRAVVDGITVGTIVRLFGELGGGAPTPRST